jgi:protein KTI12
VAPPEKCKAWNEARDDGNFYAPETCALLRAFDAAILLIFLSRLENLFMRYEEPSSMVRWDSPLFTVLWDDSSLPLDDIWRALTEGAVKSPNAGTQAVRSFLSSPVPCCKSQTTRYPKRPQMRFIP